MSLDTLGVVIEALPEAKLVCVLPAKHRLSQQKTISVTDLASEPLILISESSLMRKRWLQTFQATGINPNVVLDSTYTGPICNMVGKDMGISVLNSLTAEAYVDHDIVIRPFFPEVPCEAKLVRSARQALSESAQAFIDITKAEMALTSAIH